MSREDFPTAHKPKLKREEFRIRELKLENC